MLRKRLTLDDIVTGVFTGKTVSGVQWLPDSSAFTFTERNPKSHQMEVYRRKVDSEQLDLLMSAADLSWNGKLVEMSAYATTGQQNHLLITGAQKSIWRYSYTAPYYLYNVATKTTTALAAGENIQNVALSADNSKVAFVKDSNIYISSTDEGAKMQQLTFDGSENILNGIFDWVYEEEFQRADAFRWSPQSTHIAFWRIDQTRVKSFTLLDETKRYTETSSLKYPKVGEQNAIVKIGVVDVSTGDVVWMNIGDNTDIYIPRIDWTSREGVLAIQRLNRRQNHLELLFADIKTGETRVVVEEKSPNGWIDITDDFIFFKEKEMFISTSEKSGFRHIYLSDFTGKELAQVTKGDWEVDKVLGFDEKSQVVYFYAKRSGPMHKGVYRCDLEGKIELLSPEFGWHRANFAPDFKHFVGYSSDITTPEQVFLCKNDGTRIATLEANQISALTEYELNFPEFLTVKLADGVELNAYMIKPRDFDASKKYPVLVYGYSGPVTQLVCNSWAYNRGLWHSMLAQEGCLVFCMDHRLQGVLIPPSGTGGRGRAFKDAAYRDISKFAVADQIEGVKFLRSLNYVDSDRIAFWGWSGGGYLSCMLMMRAAEHFCAGIAVAPVSDFRNYDTIWTERYMDLLSENPDGYTAADVLTYADGLKSPFLLVHGTGDDNVHPQNTMMLVDKLIKLNKQFDLMLYPNKNHAIPGQQAQRHLYTMMTNFLKRHLKF